MDAPVGQASSRGAQSSRLPPYIRPVDAGLPAGPDGIRELTPHYFRGLAGDTAFAARIVIIIGNPLATYPTAINGAFRRSVQKI